MSTSKVLNKQIVEVIDGISLYGSFLSETEITYYYKSSKRKIYVPCYVSEFINNLDRPVRDDVDEQAWSCAIQLHNMCEAEYNAFCKGVLSYLLKTIGETLLLM